MDVMGKDLSNILHLKSSTSFEFTEESHRAKILAILPGLVKVVKSSNVAAATRLLMQVHDEIDCGEQLSLNSIEVPSGISLLEQSTYLKLATLVGKGSFSCVQNLMKDKEKFKAEINLTANEIHQRYGDISEELRTVFSELFDDRCLTVKIDDKRVKS